MHQFQAVSSVDSSTSHNDRELQSPPTTSNNSSSNTNTNINTNSSGNNGTLSRYYNFAANYASSQVVSPFQAARNKYNVDVTDSSSANTPTHQKLNNNNNNSNNNNLNINTSSILSMAATPTPFKPFNSQHLSLALNNELESNNNINNNNKNSMNNTSNSSTLFWRSPVVTSMPQYSNIYSTPSIPSMTSTL